MQRNDADFRFELYCAILTKSSYHNGWRSVKCLYFAQCKSKREKKNNIALQICAGKLQRKYIEKTVLLKNCSFLLLNILHCIFYKLKIVILALFSCSLFCIELNAHITSFHCIFKNATKNCKNWTKKLQIHT